MAIQAQVATAKAAPLFDDGKEIERPQMTGMPQVREKKIL